MAESLYLDHYLILDVEVQIKYGDLLSLIINGYWNLPLGDDTLFV